MAQISSALFDLGQMDTLANQNTAIHKLDPRAKIISTLVFIAIVISFDKYAVSHLLLFFLYLIMLTTVGNLPVTFLIKKIMLVFPFVFFIAIFNPILDKEPLMQIASINISGGWISLISIILRFFLTVGATLILIGVTGFTTLCMALDKMGMPTVFTIQLLFLYRYLYVLVDEGSRMFRAYSLRTFNSKFMSVKVFRQLIGNLLLRTIDRSQRIHMAMLSRGFDGDILVAHQFHFGIKEVVFTIGSCSIFIVLRFYNLSYEIGRILLEFIQ